MGKTKEIVVICTVAIRLLVSPAQAETTRGEPVFRVGLISDTHVSATPNGCALVAKAMELFCNERTDVICHLGDLADIYAPEGFAAYRKAIEAAFGEKVPLTLYAFGGHDRNGYKLQSGETDVNECGWRTMREKLKIPHARYDTVEFKGYPFVIISEYFAAEVAAKRIAEAIAAYPGKPVFVLEHEPAYDTVCNSVAWGNRAIRRICDQYPQAIHLSGHTHGSNRNELNIWQGGFTEVNVGCLHVWAGEEANTSRRSRHKRDDGVMVMDVFRDRIVFHRFSLTTGEEWRGDAPWTVPLPFDPATAPYRAEARKGASQPPVWPASAALKTTWTNETSFCGLHVSFPEAAHRDGTFRYRVALRDESGALVTVKETLGEFWKIPESSRGTRLYVDLDFGYFEPSRRYIVDVTPEDFYGNRGKELSGAVLIPENMPPRKTAYRTDDAMRVLTFASYSWGASVRPLTVDADGFLTVKTEMFRADLPADALAADDPKGTRYVMDFAFEDRHATRCSWLVDLADARTNRLLPDSGWRLAEGPMDRVRYRIGFVKPADGPLPLRIGFSYGDRGGRIRMTSIRIEKR